MLFNSYEFIFFFFPTVCVLFFLIGKAHRTPALVFLLLASLFFYAWWEPKYLLVIITSIIINYAIGRRMAKLGRSKALLTLGLTLNIGALVYYKYTDFFISIFNSTTGAAVPLQKIVLPLGISFFTFQQIAFLIDTYRSGKPDEFENFLEYSTFVTFFPHLIAGPLVLYKELSPQFRDKALYIFDSKKFSIGITIFLIGLFKKTFVADGVAEIATDVFNGARFHDPGFVTAWLGTLSYTIQIYFDFSGYSDMAIGLAYMLGVRLPMNFNRPYLSLNPSEFWRRWHITLGRWMHDYLYISLGGNRVSRGRLYFNLFFVFLVSGLWHGAAINFVLWGVYHGLLLGLYHSTSPRWDRLPKFLQITATFVLVCMGWILFRAENMHVASAVFKGFIGLNHLGLEQLHFTTKAYLTIPFAAFIILKLPTALEFTQLVPSEIQNRFQKFFVWTPNLKWAMGLALMGLIAILYISKTSEFIYYQF